MHPLSRRIALVVFVLATASLACTLPDLSGKTTPTSDLVSTGVAQTLQAATDAAPAPTVTDTPEAIDTPTATVEAGPSTPLPAPAQRAAYVDTGRNLWLWSDGAGAAALTATGDVIMARISPDGEQVAYVRAADFFPASLWVVQRDGSGARELMSAADLNAAAAVDGALGNIPYQVEWVPGRANLLAVGTRPVFEGPGLMLNEDLILIDTLTAARTNLLAPGMGGMFVFSPDGAQIALVKTEQIDLINADGSNRRSGVLTFPFVLTYSEYAYYAEPTWAADGSFLRVAIPPAKSLDEPDQPARLWQIPTDGSAAVQIGSVLTAPLTTPVFSPDLNRLAYLTGPTPGSGLLDLYISAADGGGASRYTNTAGRFSGWLPSSERFVYYDSGAEAPLLGTVDAMAVPLTDAASVVQIQFMTDGRVVFLARSGGNWELRVAAPATPSAVMAVFPAGDDLPLFDVMD